MLKQKEKQDLLMKVEEIEQEHNQGILLLLKVPITNYERVKEYLKSNSQKYGTLVPYPTFPPELKVISTKEQAITLVREVCNRNKVLEKIADIDVSEIFENVMHSYLL